MSTPEQVADNIHSYKELPTLTEEEKNFLTGEINTLYRAQGPVGADLSKYEGMTLYGAPVPAILEAYNVCQLQPNPGFSDDNNYLKNTMAEEAHLNIRGELPKTRLVTAAGEDVTDTVYKAYEWLRENSF
jgi:predicted aldo/keto reductase-like oxidoreductase